MTDYEKYQIRIERTPDDEETDRFSFVYQGRGCTAEIPKPDHIGRSNGAIGFSAEDTTQIPKDVLDDIGMAARLELYLLYKEVTDFKPLFREDAQRQKMLFRFAQKYLNAHLTEGQYEPECRSFRNIIRGQNVFSNRDQIRIEAPIADYIIISGYVGMHKGIYEYVETKEQVKEVIDMFLQYALKRTHHKCCEPKSIEEVEEENVESEEREL